MSACCTRCLGLLIESEVLHTEEGPWSFKRCLNCGHQSDAVVLYHQGLSAAPEPYSSPDWPVWDPVRQLLRWQERREEKKLSQTQREEE